MNSDYEILQEQYNPVVPVGWFIEHTDMRTVSPHVATESEIWIVYDGPEQAIGMALVEDHDERPARLHRIGVQSMYQREGIATALVERLLDEYGTLTCECREDSDANEFYEATGWERTEVSPGDPVDLIQWKREVNDGP